MTTWWDVINGMFESLAGIAILMHCLRLYRDKQVRGVSLLATIFFTSWGVWNCLFYPAIGQFWSFIGGLFVMSANGLWVGMMVFYITKEKRNERQLS